MASLVVAFVLLSFTVCQSSGGNRCDTNVRHTEKTNCINCRTNIRVQCPLGYRKTTRGSGHKGCRYRIGSTSRPIRGCFHICIKMRIEPQCCDNFFGQDCQACPVGWQGKTCSDRGNCFDGISGNGTCKCRGNVDGSSCEFCPRSNQYGPQCEHTCSCVNGKCDSGVGRPGTCSCESGYGGAACDTILADCPNMNCHTNSRCLDVSGLLKCLCNSGYEGNGTTCRPINPCSDTESNFCHEHATCIHAGPAMYNCTCMEGYSGDGRSCIPIDPCQNNNGGCLVNSTVCNYTGPGKAACLCKGGYENKTESGCSLIDICGQQNFTCDPRANCSTVDEDYAIGVKCQCPFGTINVGLKCYSDLITELMNANESGSYENQLNRAIQMFSSYYFDELFHSSSYTLLVPMDSAFGSELDQSNSTVMWKARARAHIVFAKNIIDFSEETANSLFPLLGYNASIKARKPLQSADSSSDDDDAGFFASFTLGGLPNGHILTSANWAVNGLFYITDTFLNPPATFPILNYDASDLPLLQALQSIPSATQFLRLWKRSYLTQDWLRKGEFSFTLLIPSDVSFSMFSADALKFLSSFSGRYKLDMIMQNHVVSTPLTVSALASKLTVATTRGNLPVNVSESGVIYIGQQNAKVLISEIPLQGGNYLYMIDRVLVPSSAQPLVDNICTDINEITVQGICGDCQRTIEMCPDGAIPLLASANMQRCIYEVMVTESQSLGQRLGCKSPCKKNETTNVCCEGFYGADCESCPGPTHNACYGNGICEDGKQGTGLCRCNHAYQGKDCFSCFSNSSFGLDCNTNCSCLHGVCDNTVLSRGNCIEGTCLDGWAGENCDRRMRRCGQQGIACHQHATCIVTEEDVNVESCVCDPGYTGAGLDCIQFNPCVDADDRGGCDLNAVCMYLGQGKVGCTCQEFYTGNGRICEAINHCNDGENGGCSVHADCIFSGPGQSICQCKPGYRGNGLICNEINSCLENNGGCHYRANCQSTGPGLRVCQCTAGYSGNGLQCVGSLLVEIAEHPQLSVIKHWVNTISSVHDLFLGVQLTSVTALLPRDDAWRAMKTDDFQFWANSDHLPFLLRSHMIKGVVTSSSLSTITQLQTLISTVTVSVTNVTDGIDIHNIETDSTFSEKIPTLGSNFAKVIMPDLMTFNGLVHIIDGVILPPRDVVDDHISLVNALENSTGTPLAPYSLFLSYLNKTGIITRINASGQPYTIFAVSNQILDPSNLGSSITTLFSYHVILGKLIRVNSIQSGQHESTLAGAGYQVSLVKQSSTIEINGQAIADEDIRTQHGIVQGLATGLLTLIKQRCDKSEHRVVKTNCLPCSMPSVCPGGTKKLVQIPCRPSFSTSLTHFTLGCKLICLKRNKIPSCCSNFFGPECNPCAGGVGNACSNNGVCYDGQKGNGTCQCTNNKFAGPACDDCAPGRYGHDCNINCTCVNGTCDDGRMSSGICVCNAGYFGKHCDKLIDLHDACGGKCNGSSRCVESSTSAMHAHCTCGEGFTGSGDSCLPINPCHSNIPLCHAFASCSYAGPGQHHCKCKNGYTGDGLYCAEIDPCLQQNFTSCDVNANCFHTGANKSNCVCASGYTGDGKTCREINPCETNNGGCHMYATCRKSGPGMKECKCLLDYVGDGIEICTGTIFATFQSDPRFAWFINHLLVRSTLNSPGPITVFLPDFNSITTSVMSQLDGRFFLSHIVGCDQLTVNKLQGLSQLYSLSGKAINVTSSGNTVFLNGNIRIDKGLPLANGIVYNVSGFLYQPSNNTRTVLANDAPNLKNYYILQSLGAKKFSQLLNFTNSLNLLSDSIYKTWTLFIPTDKAFSELSAHTKRLLLSDIETAKEYIRYHMIRQSMLMPNDAIPQLTLTTMQGSEVTVGCSTAMKGKFILNQGEASVVSFAVENLYGSQGSIVSTMYFIDTVLEPPSIGGRCDFVTNVTIDGTCTFCVQSAMDCPTGMKRIGQKFAVCASKIATPFGSYKPAKPLAGCQPICSFDKVTPRCCADHYGKDCHACPGGPGNACFKNGNCSAGINGTGTCTCKPGYTGYACERCESGRYGKNCSSCLCSIHGTCSEGINSNGACFCDVEWAGVKCDKKLAHPSTCQQNCTENAVCLEGGECQCEPGFIGNGNYSCELEDLCIQQPCSIHAQCRQNGRSISCTCNSPYVGDGYVCEGNDPCNDPTNPTTCHTLAQCVFVGPGVSKCMCPPGYHGDGRYICISNTEWQQPLPVSCSVNNGHCSVNADCITPMNPSVKAKVLCKCKEGYVGDGSVCNGNILQVLKSGEIDSDKFYQKVVRRDRLYAIKLKYSQNITMFVPRNEAVAFKRLNRRIASRHVVSGHTYTASDLSNMSGIVVDTGHFIPVQTLNDGSIYINGVKVFRYDIPATNGIIHILDGVISAKTIVIPVSSTSGIAMSSISLTTKTLSTMTTKAGMPIVPIDGGGIPHVSSLPNVTIPMHNTNSISVKSSSVSSSGVKIGIAVAIFSLLLIGIALYYWKRRSNMFVFRPLSELAKISSRGNEARYGSSIMSGSVGMANPAYDSTAFQQPRDDFTESLLTDFPVANPLDGDGEH